MNTRVLWCLGLALLVFGRGPALAEEPRSGVLKLPQDIQFKGPLTGAPQTALLYGDPTKPGLFVTRVKFSAGWMDPPHWHPDEARTVAVLNGTLYFASGERRGPHPLTRPVSRHPWPTQRVAGSPEPTAG